MIIRLSINCFFLQVVTGRKTFSGGVRSYNNVTINTVNNQPHFQFETEESVYGNPNSTVNYGKNQQHLNRR